MNDNFNQENTTNFCLPPTVIKKLNNSKSNSKSNITNKNKNNIFGLPKSDLTENSKTIQKSDFGTNKTQSKLKKQKSNLLTQLKTENPIIPKKKITTIIINEVEKKNVPNFSGSKSEKKFSSKYIFCIYRRKAYPYKFGPNSKICDIFNKLSRELKIDKKFLEFRINEKIINQKDEEKYISNLVAEEKNDKIYVTKIYPNYNMINNLYNKNYDNLVIIENSKEISEIEKKLNKFLEEYHMEKDYYFKKISDNKYSFGFSYPDFAFDFNRLLLILKRTENDFKDIKSYLKLDKKKRSKIFEDKQQLK